MLIYLKNKDKLIVDEFIFKCCIGKNGKTKNKFEGDLKTPKGTFKLSSLYYRADRISKPKTKLSIIQIKKNFAWCNDKKSKEYNKRIRITKKLKHEKLYRKDYKYDLLIPIEYNFNKIILGKGSAIFLHLTNSYKPTAGCIAISKKDFYIMLKLLDRDNKIIIN